MNLGVQMFDYSPCHISLVAKSKMTCSLVFWYFIKIVKIQSAIERNFTQSDNYLMSIGISNPSNEKKKKPKSNVQRKKDNKEMEVVASNVTPICFHHFLHKDVGEIG